MSMKGNKKPRHRLGFDKRVSHHSMVGNYIIFRKRELMLFQSNLLDRQACHPCQDYQFF